MERDAVDEVELGMRAQAGDVEALAALLELNRASLYATSIRLLGSRADALDAVQDTCLVALVRVGELRDPGAARAWLHAIVRNVCLMQLRQRRELPCEEIELRGATPDLEETLAEHALREWLWWALDALAPDERLAVILRYFTRCESYEAIARLTAVPIGTVRSRLNRGRSRLHALLQTASATPAGHRRLEAEQREQWEDFYGTLHEHPTPRTYQELFAQDVDVGDRSGRWTCVREWSAHEREAIDLGVRANIVELIAAKDVTVIELDFTNPAAAPRHCPPQATFVHHLQSGRSQRVRIHYPIDRPPIAPP
jgi:RNA polymerase sigma-70 factor (ECF subfamily)